MCVSFKLFLCHVGVPVSPGGELLHVLGTLIFISDGIDFVAAAQGMSHDYLALVKRGGCIPGSHGTETIRK